MNRKKFIQRGMMALGATVFIPGISKAAFQEPNFTLEQIKEFVFAAHNDYEKTKNIVEESPLILNCTNQAKKGDFETALGGASHMGRNDIADLLVARGARMDLFNLTFLGYTDFVKKLINQSPQYLTAYGPHGFTLLHHAKVGKHTDFALWLEDQGLTEDRFMNIFG